MVFTQCQTVPLAVDLSPPIVSDIVALVDTTNVMRADFNASDALSGLMVLSFGLGRSRDDNYVWDWVPHEKPRWHFGEFQNHTFLEFTASELPEVRLRIASLPGLCRTLAGSHPPCVS
jgi:hypothetical protein